MASMQGSLADVWVDPRMGSNRRLEAINALLDWAPLERLGQTVQRRQGRAVAWCMVPWCGGTDPMPV